MKHPQHRRIENRGQFQKGIFQQQGNIRIFFNLLLHQLDIILKHNPTPSDVRDNVDKSDGGLFNVDDLDHVVEVLAQVEQVLTDLN